MTFFYLVCHVVSPSFFFFLNILFKSSRFFVLSSDPLQKTITCKTLSKQYYLPPPSFSLATGHMPPRYNLNPALAKQTQTGPQISFTLPREAYLFTKVRGNPVFPRWRMEYGSSPPIFTCPPCPFFWFL